MSLCAAAVIWAGFVWSSWTNSFNGWPLTPPLSLTQLKYAWIMFGPSVKSVPGWCVSMVPMLIGVPVALTPGLGPHDETAAVVPPLALVPALVPVPAELDVAALEGVSPPACARGVPPPGGEPPRATETAATSRQREQRDGSHQCESDPHPWHEVINPHGSPLLRVSRRPRDPLEAARILIVDPAACKNRLTVPQCSSFDRDSALSC